MLLALVEYDRAAQQTNYGKPIYHSAVVATDYILFAKDIHPDGSTDRNNIPVKSITQIGGAVSTLKKGLVHSHFS